MSNENIIEYVRLMDSCGADILKDSWDSSQAKCATELIASTTLAVLSDELSPVILMVMMSQKSDFLKLVALSMKLAIGLAVIEELH